MRTGPAGAVLSLFFALLPCRVAAQFLRIGPFDFDTVARVEGIYTTNVEQERESEATDERKDYYVILGLDLVSSALLSPSTEIQIDTGIAIEKHYNRPDLDNSEEPFGRARIRASSEMRHLTLDAEVFAQRTSESAEGVFIPGSRKGRDVRDENGYSLGLGWAQRSLTLGAGYAFNRERHLDVQFQDGDEDETAITFNALWQFLKALSVSYDYSHERTKLINDPTAYDGWEDTHLALLNWDIYNRPRLRLTYSFGYEREDEEDVKGDWLPTHRIDMGSDEPLFESDTLRFTIYATYTFERDEEEEEVEDDINFTYGARLEHDLSRTAMHEVWVTREPYDTLGSTEETEHSELGYKLSKDNLFIYNLDFAFSALYEEDEPKGEMFGPVEKKITYLTAIGHTQILTRRLQRSLDYFYSYEDSNLEEEFLDEHRVTLSFEYMF